MTTTRDFVLAAIRSAVVGDPVVLAETASMTWTLLTATREEYDVKSTTHRRRVRGYDSMGQAHTVVQDIKTRRAEWRQVFEFVSDDGSGRLHVKTVDGAVDSACLTICGDNVTRTWMS